MAAKRKVKRRTYAPENPAQTGKFLEAAKKHRGVDADGRAFRHARSNLLKPKGAPGRS